MTKDAFDQLEDVIDDTAEAVEEFKSKKDNRDKRKFYICNPVFVADTQKELREYLEENEDTTKQYLIVRGSEVLPKKKVTFVI